MFNKIKAIRDLRSQAKTIEHALSGVQATGTAQGVSLTMNGKQEILALTIPETLDRAKIASAVQHALAECLRDLQKGVQKAIKENGGLPDMSQLGL